jgi:hypothetical protein
MFDNVKNMQISNNNNNNNSNKHYRKENYVSPEIPCSLLFSP